MTTKDPFLSPAVVQTLILIGGGVTVYWNAVFGIWLLVAWLIPIVVSIGLGLSRGRTGWMWGLFLGWLGVLILAIMRPLPEIEQPALNR